MWRHIFSLSHALVPDGHYLNQYRLIISDVLHNGNAQVIYLRGADEVKYVYVP